MCPSSSFALDGIPRWQQSQKYHKRYLDRGFPLTSEEQQGPGSTAAQDTAYTGPKVALLLRGEEGAVRSSQSNLAVAVTRRLRRAHALTLIFSTHKDKGDTLLVFDREGVPQEAYFGDTAVFRDAFSAV